MEQSATQRWFLRKFEDGTVFGPLTFEQLERWASNAQVAPHDAISTDQVSWTKAPMVPELAMDWLVEITSERYYGPTTLGAIQEFVRLGDIDGDTFIINACDGSRMQIQQIPGLIESATMAAPADSAAPGHEIAAHEPQVSGIEIEMRERIRDLEQSLAEERRAYLELERHYRALEQKHNELVDLHATGQTS